jgi:hypothetical protein
MIPRTHGYVGSAADAVKYACTLMWKTVCGLKEFCLLMLGLLDMSTDCTLSGNRCFIMVVCTNTSKAPIHVKEHLLYRETFHSANFFF